MGFRQIARSGLVLIALSMPAFYGCNREVSRPDKKPTASQEDYSQVELRALRAEAKLRETQDKLESKVKQYAELEKEKGELEKTKEQLIDYSHQFPINTPENVIKTVEKLRRQITKGNVVFEIGSTDYDRMQMKNGELLTKVSALKNLIENARPYLERMHPPKYFSELTGNEIPQGLTPYDKQVGENEELRLRLNASEQNYRNLELRVDKIKQEIWDKDGKTIDEKDAAIKRLFVERNAFEEAYNLWRDCALRLDPHLSTKPYTLKGNSK